VFDLVFDLARVFKKIEAAQGEKTNEERSTLSERRRWES
jgi:hypothetical protein